MEKNKLFIIFGQHGKIAKSIKNSLLLRNKNVININWEETKKLINKKKDINRFFEINYRILLDEYSLIFINCLRENNEISTSLRQFKKFKTEFNKLNTDFKYIYLSTYEPNKIQGTNYRKVKFDMEKAIKKGNGIIVRVAYYLLNDEYKIYNKNCNFKYLTNLKFKPILIPITLCNDLLNSIINISEGHNNNNLIRCYTEICGIRIASKFPFLIITRFLESKNNNYFPFPFDTLSKFFLKLSNLLWNLKILKKLAIFLEKPYSLFLQQTILYKKFFIN